MDFFTDDEIARLSETVVRCDFLVELEFQSETARLWNGFSPLTSGGHEWQPVKGLGLIEGLEYQTGEQSQAISLQLSGIPSQTIDILALALEETPDVTQQLVTVYLQLFDAEWQPQGDPMSFWYGFMQPPRVSRTEIEGVEGAVQTITVQAENALFNRARPAYGRYTDRDQQARFPGDKGLQIIASLRERTYTYPSF